MAKLLLSIKTNALSSSAKSAISAVLIVVSSLAIPASLSFCSLMQKIALVLYAGGMVGLPTGILLPLLGKKYTIKTLEV
jgi:hypothetical protein